MLISPLKNVFFAPAAPSQISIFWEGIRGISKTPAPENKGVLESMPLMIGSNTLPKDSPEAMFLSYTQSCLKWIGFHFGLTASVDWVYFGLTGSVDWIYCFKRSSLRLTGSADWVHFELTGSIVSEEVHFD